MDTLLKKPNLLYIIAIRCRERIPDNELKDLNLAYDKTIGVYRFKLYLSMVIVCSKLRNEIYYSKIRRLLTLSDRKNPSEIWYVDDFVDPPQDRCIIKKVPITTINGLVDGEVTYKYNPAAGTAILWMICSLQIVKIPFSLGTLIGPRVDKPEHTGERMLEATKLLNKRLEDIQKMREK